MKHYVTITVQHPDGRVEFAVTGWMQYPVNLKEFTANATGFSFRSWVL